MRIDVHHYHHYGEQETIPSWAAELQRIIIRKLENIIMATKEEVQADLAEIRTEVSETRGVATSAVLFIKELLDRVTTAAATATDLDAFRAELALIKAETQATEDDLKAAMNTNPPT